jgi:hypothetical protein
MMMEYKTVELKETLLLQQLLRHKKEFLYFQKKNFYQASY